MQTEEKITFPSTGGFGMKETGILIAKRLEILLPILFFFEPFLHYSILRFSNSSTVPA
jgi:hypothetical protein